MERVKLNAKWKLYGSKVGMLNATVPGCVHTDLIENGLIKDIFWRDNNNYGVYTRVNNWPACGH